MFSWLLADFSGRLEKALPTETPAGT